MTDLHELARILALAAVALTVCVCLYKLGAWAIRKLDRPCPPEPRADVRPVPEDVSTPDADNVVAFNRALRGTG